MQPDVLTVRDFCQRLLQRGDLAAKLAPPRCADGSALSDESPGPAVFVERPRSAWLALPTTS
jgi:hypothetical protein